MFDAILISTTSSSSQPPLLDFDQSEQGLKSLVGNGSITSIPPLFYLVNHGIPEELMTGVLLTTVEEFHEWEEKKSFHSRDLCKKFMYYSNIDPEKAKCVSWSDTMDCMLAPGELKPADIPNVCRTKSVGCRYSIPNPMRGSMFTAHPELAIVNVGDFMQLVTNIFKVVYHRVLVNHEKPRKSVACFFGTHYLRVEECGRPFGPNVHEQIDGTMEGPALSHSSNFKRPGISSGVIGRGDD